MYLIFVPAATFSGALPPHPISFSLAFFSARNALSLSKMPKTKDVILLDYMLDVFHSPAATFLSVPGTYLAVGSLPSSFLLTAAIEGIKD